MKSDGIINLYKPQGYTSHDCVAIVRRAIGVKKVGHTGTLDPMAEGVLPICVGKATRIIEYFDADFKTYECTLELGIATDTLDIWGKEIKNLKYEVNKLINDKMITREKIISVLKSFVGVQLQTPPKFSALKVNGKRLYEYARENLDVAIKARKIYIDSIKLINFDKEKMQISFEVICSKGTYVRTICADIGEKLGTIATMVALKRVKSGVFEAALSLSMDKLKEIRELANSQEILSEMFIDPDETMENLGKLIVKSEKLNFLLNGVYLYAGDVKIISEPKYKLEKSKHEIPDYFVRAYRAYKKDKTEDFLGVVFFDESTKTYKAEKILFSR
ncbi:MAG: tRNA pseudouridine(55) synthase TruB [Eubacteriales bacterium]